MLNPRLREEVFQSLVDSQRRVLCGSRCRAGPVVKGRPYSEDQGDGSALRATRWIWNMRIWPAMKVLQHAMEGLGQYHVRVSRVHLYKIAVIHLSIEWMDDCSNRGGWTEVDVCRVCNGTGPSWVVGILGGPSFIRRARLECDWLQSRCRKDQALAHVAAETRDPHSGRNWPTSLFLFTGSFVFSTV